MSNQLATGLSGLFFMLAISPSQTVAASSESVLYDFAQHSAPLGRVLEDESGNFYATAQGPENGAVYKFKQKRGVWSASLLYQFGEADGHHPQAGVIKDPSTGVLFGVTHDGGANNYGTIYSLTPDNNHWTEKVLHDFDGSDGVYPVAELRRDSVTNLLYGTAAAGGPAGCGTVFQFDPSTSDFSVIYAFAGGSDGCWPVAQLRPGTKPGTLIGATQHGGDANAGTVYLLTQKGGIWEESVLHAFNGTDGSYPSDLDVANDGTVYGVAARGGSSHAGVVFRLVSGHPWKFKTLFNFSGVDGDYPVGLNLQGGGTTIFGTTQFGGLGSGVVFKLQPVGKVWQQTVLYKFSQGTDGRSPGARPAIDPKSGTLYGATLSGGTQRGGTFYSVSP